MFFMIALSLTPILSIEFPRFLAFWPLIIGLCTGLWVIFARKQRLTISKPYFIGAFVISALCLASTLWSISPNEAFKEAAIVTTILMFGGLFVSVSKSINLDELKPYSWMFPVAVIIGALLCSYDLFTNMSLFSIIHNKTVEDKINTSVMNRAVVCTSFSYLIALLFINNAAISKNIQIALTITMSAAVILMLSLTQSQAGQIMFVIGLAAIVAFPARFKASYYVLAALTTIALLTTPIIVESMYSTLTEYAQANHWISEAYVGNRVEIWNFVTKYAMNNPLYGYGIEATNYVRHFDHEYIYHNEPTTLHPHNFSVQFWMEFGIIGIAIATGILSTFLYSLSRIEDLFTRKVLTSLFIVSMIAASMTYGMWQSWWLGQLIFMIAISSLLSNKNKHA